MKKLTWEEEPRCIAVMEPVERKTAIVLFDAEVCNLKTKKWKRAFTLIYTQLSTGLEANFVIQLSSVNILKANLNGTIMNSPLVICIMALYWDL